MGDSLKLFGSGLSQHARLITLASAQDSGRESVNELFCFYIDALSVSTDLELPLFIGDELTVTLLQPDGSRRATACGSSRRCRCWRCAATDCARAHNA
jgi:type VI secretion system secreted protein VgrG